jgi:protein phosphatase
MTPRISCSYLTHPGYHRYGNEDSILVDRTVIAGVSMESPEKSDISSLPALFCVADGVGGSAHGEIASRSVLEYFSHFPQVPVSEEGAVSLVTGAKEMLDEMVLRDASYHGLATTVSGLILLDDGVVIFNSGDSRVYRIDNGIIERVSHDHSLVQELCDQGQITPDQVYTHPYRNIITAVVSGDLNRPSVSVMTASFPVSGTERFLLCTDGVWEVVRDPEIAEICSSGDLIQAAGILLATCLDRGGPDNISLILVGRDESS